MWEIARYSLLGAILAVSASGFFGFDSFMPDAIVAFLGGGATAVAIRTMILV